MTTHETIAVRGSDGSVTYVTYDDLPNYVYEWEYWASNATRSYFRFRFVPVGNVFRIYIVAQPSYRGRSESLVPTHRHHDDYGYYICIEAGSEPETVAEAISWYGYWAEKTVNYIETGRAFS